METSIRLFEWGKHAYKAMDLPQSQDKFLNGFQSYLNEVWESRNWYKEIDQADKNVKEERSGKEQRFFTFTSNELKAHNYVGVVQYEGQRFEVYPKIFSDRLNHDFRNYFQHI